MGSKIASIRAMEILDSRGNPTLRAFVTLDNGVAASASVPSGASTGENEACEVIVEAIQKAGYKPGNDVAIALDPAASSFYEKGVYNLSKSGQEGEQDSARSR